ncbi:MAG TPA: DUF58 domain-containing protein [Verrucomicrobiae bacterium]|nr:DUF58 domain-containing protein [Verrucomicrobiae bacterium]
MSSPWIRLRESVFRRIRYRVTKIGAAFTLALMLVGTAAMFTGNNLLFLIGATMLATLLVAGFISRLCLAALELDFLVPEHVSAGRAVPGKLFVRNQKWFMPSFSIAVEGIRDPASPAMKSGVYFPLIPSRTTLEETVEVSFPRRGVYRENSFAFSTGFPFGFLDKQAHVTLRRDMVVYPSIEPQPGFEDLLSGISGEIETHYRGLGRDFYRIRPYEISESARHVDWKATAKVGSLQVREFAREQEQTVEVYLDRDIPPAFDQWFEHAIDCCAFLVWRLSNQGASIHFRSAGFELRQPEEGDIYAILKYLALAYQQHAATPDPPRDDTSYKLVFTPSPRKFQDAGWMGARILDPDLLPVGKAGGAGL